MNKPQTQGDVKAFRTPLSQGNEALRKGDGARAIAHYVQVIEQYPELTKSISANVVLARQKYRAGRERIEKSSVAICGWDLAHNAADRVYTLATLYETFAQVEIIGSLFPSFGREIWKPIHDTAIAKHTFIVEDESQFLNQAIQLVAAHPYDIVHLSKPRAPNIFFGILYKLIWDAKVLMDIDDEELAYVGEEAPIDIAVYLKQQGKLPELKNLAGKEWTRLAVGLAKEFDGVTVCNAALQTRYGGEIVRHARDEQLYASLKMSERAVFSESIRLIVKHFFYNLSKFDSFYAEVGWPRGKDLPKKTIQSSQSDVGSGKNKRGPPCTRGIGNLDRIDDSGVLFGWAALKDSTKKLDVSIVSDDGQTVLCTANSLRHDLIKAKVNNGDGRHGFEISISMHLCDGCEHRFELYDADAGCLIAERTFLVPRKPLDIYELRAASEQGAALLLVFDFHGKSDALALARLIKAKIEGRISVIRFVYARLGATPEPSFVEEGIKITNLQCSPGLSEHDAIFTILKARVLSGFTSIFFARYSIDSDISLQSDADKLVLGASSQSLGIVARTLERTQLGWRARDVLQDWCNQLEYDGGEDVWGLRCTGLIRIEPALISELGALDLDSTAEKCELLAIENGFIDLVFGFIAYLARHGGLRVLPYEEIDAKSRPPTKIAGRVPRYIAFYLPQFHPIPENDRWWGAGFTEWRNVVRATSLFKGHYQPRVPADLGFYDLRMETVQLEQARIAKTYGLDGFCYYYYWFDGVRLLNTPIDALMRPGAPDFPFCICWANENWTRNWDGHNKHILIQQNYSFESNRKFIREVMPIMADPRYIRYAGRPILIIYRILHMDNWTRTAEMWREECRIFGLGEIHLAAVRTNFDALSDYPAEYGLDSFVLFPPHETHNVDKQHQKIDLHPNFSGQIFGYDDAVAGDIDKYSQWSGGLVHRGAMVAWDNTARRLEHARVYTGATPMKFRMWVKQIIEQQSNRPAASSFVFINAWNEWAEGTYLEPDSRFGYAYLEALRSLSRRADCMAEVQDSAVIGERLPRHLLLNDAAPGRLLPDLRRRLSSLAVSHCDYRQGFLAHPESRQTVLVCAHYVGMEVFGGERSLLNVLQGLAANKYDVVTVLPSFENEDYLNEVRDLSRSVYHVPYKQLQRARPTDEHFVLDVSDILVAESVDLLYANTIVLHEPIIAAQRLNIPIVIHVRELIDRDEFLCNQIGLPADEILSTLEATADGIIANSDATYRLFPQATNVYLVKNCISPASSDLVFASDARLRLGIVSNNLPKKGLGDLIRVAQSALDLELPVDFVNVGPTNGYVKKLLAEERVPANLRFVGYRNDAAAAMSELDVLLSLSSFAESFGRSVAEALSYGKPVIGYKHGALDELVVEGQSGFLVPYQNTDAVVEKIKFFIDNRHLVNIFGARGKAHIESNYSQSKLNFQLGEALNQVFERKGKGLFPGGHYGKRNNSQSAKSITIVVPIFNGYRFVKRCIESLIKHVPARTASVILIDDCSTDPKLKDYLREVVEKNGYRLISNPTNLGYTTTINIGVNAAGKDDIVLLNSDAEVTDRWLAGLRVAAYSCADIGTATAMSDNAGAFSFPKQGVKNDLPVSLRRDEISTRLLSATGKLRPVEVPTGSGFCMYIKRALIASIGHFDEMAFPRGYGEENDYCMRAIAKGWRNVISPWAYVFHERTVSFGKEKEQLVKEGTAVVMERYPEYGQLAHEAFSSEPISLLQKAVNNVFKP